MISQWFKITLGRSRLAKVQYRIASSTGTTIAAQSVVTDAVGVRGRMDGGERFEFVADAEADVVGSLVAPSFNGGAD